MKSVQLFILWKGEHSCERNTLTESKRANKIYFAHLGLLTNLGLLLFCTQPHNWRKSMLIYFPISFLNPQVLKLLQCWCLHSPATISAPALQQSALCLPMWDRTWGRGDSSFFWECLIFYNKAWPMAINGTSGCAYGAGCSLGSLQA